MHSTIKIIAIGVLATMSVGCREEHKATVAQPTRVKIEAVEQSVTSMGRTYSGTVEESSGTALSFAAPGTISRFVVNVGDRVAKGQLIATLDATSLRNAYDIAQATVASAQDAYDRMKILHDANSLPDMKWVEVQNALSQAKSAAAIAKRSLDDANLYASQSGYVSEKMADVGVNAIPGVPVVKIVTINPVKVNISVPENEIAGISSTSQALIKIDALGGKTFSGRFAEKGVSAKMLSRAYDVKYRVDNPGSELLPGMICDVTLASDSLRNVIAVPADAVLLDADNKNFVWLAKDGKAAKRIVTVDGLTPDSRVIVADGLVMGDSLIVSGQQKVSQGTPVVNINK